MWGNVPRGSSKLFELSASTFKACCFSAFINTRLGKMAMVTLLFLDKHISSTTKIKKRTLQSVNREHGTWKEPETFEKSHIGVSRSEKLLIFQKLQSQKPKDSTYIIGYKLREKPLQEVSETLEDGQKSSLGQGLQH